MSLLGRLESNETSEQVDAKAAVNLYDVISENTEEGNEKLRVFLQDGGDPNACITTVKEGNEKKITPILIHAFKSCNFSAVEMLCTFGANPNLTENEEYPVLALALFSFENLKRRLEVSCNFNTFPFTY